MDETPNTVEIGRELSEARVRRGETLDEVAAVLRIRREYLAALEEGNWSGMPGEVYGEGFLRSYARYLDLDPDRLLAQRREDLGPARYGLPGERVRRVAGEPSVPSRRRRERLGRRRHRRTAVPRGARDRAEGYTPPSLGWLLAVIVVLLLVGVYLLRQAERPASRRVGLGVGHAVVGRAHRRGHVPRKSKPEVPPTRTKPRRKLTTPRSTVAATLKETTSGFNKQGGFFADYDVSRSGPVHVTMVFGATCWTAYWANGKPVDYPSGRTYTPGEKATFSASHYVSVRIGNIFAPAIRVDGTPIRGLAAQSKGRVTTLTVTAPSG